MKMKKTAKLISISALTSISVFLTSMAAKAASSNIMPPAPTGVPQAPLSDMINKISTVILTLVGVIAILFLIIGGFQYITASGNPDQVQRAKMTIMYSIIGIVVAILAFVLVQFVVNTLIK